MAQIERGGVASFYLDGSYVEVAAAIDVKMGGYIRTAKVSSNGVAGFTSKWMPPEVTVEALDGPAVSIAALKAINGQTLQVQMNNGKTYQLYAAFQIDDPDIKIADGQVGGLKFSGSRCQEILAP